MTSMNSWARAWRVLESSALVRLKLRASSMFVLVTMFQPMRPPLIWSMDAMRREKLYGWL